MYSYFWDVLFESQSNIIVYLNHIPCASPCCPWEHRSHHFDPSTSKFLNIYNLSTCVWIQHQKNRKILWLKRSIIFLPCAWRSRAISIAPSSTFEVIKPSVWNFKKIGQHLSRLIVSNNNNIIVKVQGIITKTPCKTDLWTFDPVLRAVSGWCTLDLMGSRAGCDISSPSSLRIDTYLTQF